MMVAEKKHREGVCGGHRHKEETVSRENSWGEKGTDRL